MKNKHLLKCLSIFALASLFVTPIILNSIYIDKVDDNVSGVNEQKKLSNDVNYDDEISPQASITYNKVDLHSKLVDEQHCAKSSYQTFPTLDSEGPIYANVCNGQWTSGGKFYYAKYFDGLVSGRNYRVTYKVLNCGFEDEFISDDDGYNDSCSLIFGGTNDPTKRYNGYGEVNTSNMGIIYSKRGLGSEYVNSVSSFTFTAQSSEFNFMAYMNWSTYYSSYNGKAISLRITLEEEADSVGPLITANKGYSISLPVGTSERITLDWIKKNKLFYAHDAVDGDVTDSVSFFGEPDINYNVTGTREITLMYHDKSNNYSSVTLTVIIGDFEKPTYSIKKSTIVLECPNTISNDELLANVTFSDNYDSNVKKTIITNNYSQKTVLGIYSVTIRGTDSSGNYTDATFYVKVQDTIKPSVTGIANGSTIRSGTFNISDSGSGIASVTLDGASKTLTNGKLEINGSSYKDGSHTLVVKDKADNKTEITFTIDNTAPVVTFKNAFASDSNGSKIYQYIDSKSLLITGGCVSYYIDNVKYTISNVNDSLWLDLSSLKLSTGVHTLSRVSDNVGNETGSYKFFIGGNSINGSAISSNFYTKDDTITLTSAIGFKRIYIDCAKNNNIICVDNSFALTNTSSVIKLSDYFYKSSVTNFYITAIDLFDNRYEATIQFDCYGPEVTGLENNSRFNTDKTIKFNDNASYIKSFKLNGVVINVPCDYEAKQYVSSTNRYSYVLGSANLKQGVNTITEITDRANNVSDVSYSFIYDTKSPVISGPSPVETGKHITAQDVLAMFSATDEVDGSCSVELVSSTIKDSVGSYVVVLRSTDKTGNSSEISVNVVIKDVDPPVIYVRKDSLVVIKIVEKSELTYENLLSIFKSLYPDKYDYNDENISVQVLSNGFNIGTEKNKEVNVEVLNSLTGEKDNYTLSFSSYSLKSSTDEDKKDDDKKDNDKKGDSDKDSKSWWSKLWSNIVKYVKKAWNWVTGLFKKDDNNKPTESVKIVDTSEVNSSGKTIVDSSDIVNGREDFEVPAEDNNNDNEAEYIVW